MQKHSAIMHPNTSRSRQIPALLLGAVAALLSARLVLQLFAARPDNPFVAFLLWLTNPLIAPLRFLDAHQPRFGAVLELSTLALILLCVLVGVGLGLWQRSVLRQRRIS
jgi:uncharacterized protein YggT (Ycf19 family)